MSTHTHTHTGTQSQSEILEKSLLNDGNGGVSVVDDHTRMPAASASAIEHFQSLLKQKEGELANAQVPGCSECAH